MQLENYCHPVDLIQAIKVEIGFYLRDLGYRTGDPYAIWHCALDIFYNDISPDTYDYAGSIEFYDDCCTVARCFYDSTPNGQLNIVTIYYSEPNLLELIETILRDK